jgi:DNA-binding beta-propeller fold protein YncE
VVVKKLLLVLVPLVLSAQVEVDTFMRLPTRLGEAFFIPEVNKLYVMPRGNGGENLYVLDCSTYTLKTQIPFGPPPAGTRTRFSWNPLRQKLYVTSRSPLDSTLVIDVTADTVIGWLKVYHDWRNDVYLSDIDARFKPSVDTLFEFECATDTVIRRLPIHCTCASWDSVGRKLYVGQGSYKKLYVYDYLADSCLKVIDVSAIQASYPDACVFSRTHRRAYVSSFQFELMGEDYVGIVDTDRDTLLRVLPVRVTMGLYNQVAVDEQDGKVYITDNDGRYDTPDTMWVVSCAMDSVLKKFECVHMGSTDMCIRWVPWSNRVYLANIYPDLTHKSSLVVIDCSTDSVMVPGMLVSDDFIRDIQLDPLRERIFVIGVDSTNVYVLHDVEGGVVEEPASTGPALASGLQVQPTSDGLDLSYSIASPCRVDLSVYDLMGREVRQLMAGEQLAGEQHVFWDCLHENQTPVARGVYFIRLDTPGFRSVKKAVVTR